MAWFGALDVWVGWEDNSVGFYLLEHISQVYYFFM